MTHLPVVGNLGQAVGAAQVDKVQDVLLEARAAEAAMIQRETQKRKA